MAEKGFFQSMAPKRDSVLDFPSAPENGWMSVGARDDGRIAVQNPDGRVQTEYQATVHNPYGPGFINIPTIFGGIPLQDEENNPVDKQALEIMMKNNMIDPDTGSTHYQQSFATPDEAVQASMKNSRSIEWQ